MGKITVIKLDGKSLEVDTGACVRFGVESGARILLKCGRSGTAIGVAPAVASSSTDGKPAPDALWVQLDGDSGASHVVDKENISPEPEA